MMNFNGVGGYSNFGGGGGGRSRNDRVDWWSNE